MDPNTRILYDLCDNNKYKTLTSFLDRFDVLITRVIGVKYADVLDIDKDFLNEITTFPKTEAIVDFGKTLRDVNCVILDAKNRQHDLWLRCTGPQELRVTDSSVQWSVQNRVYRSLHEVIRAFKKHVESLEHYFYVLDRIQQCCTVMEPVKPTYKDDKRIIVLVDKVWLSVEVSPDGSARDLRLVGQYKKQYPQLENLLKAWVHDEDVAINVKRIICCLKGANTAAEAISQVAVEVPECAICLCVELPGGSKVPKPLCSNPKCGVYFHKICLYECLISSRPASSGVAIGSCPSCYQPVACNMADD